MAIAYLYFALLLLMGLTVGLIGPALPFLSEQTSSTPSQISFIFAARALGAMTGSLAGGRAYDAYNGHRVLAVALIGLIPVSVLVPNTPLLFLLVIIVYVSGCCEGAVHVGTNTLLIRRYRERVNPYMNALHFSFGIGATLAPFCVSLALSELGGIDASFYAVSALAAMLLVPVVRMDAPEHETTHRRDDSGSQPRSAVVVYFVLTFMLYVGSEATIGGWIFTFALEESSISTAGAALLTSLFWGGLTAGRLVGVQLIRRFAPERLVPLQMTAGLLCLGFISLASSSFVWLSAGTLLYGLSIASVFPMTMSLASQSMKLTGRVTGTFFIGGATGGMTMPWLTGQLFEPLGPYSVQMVSACSLLAALVMVLTAIRRSNRTDAQNME